jgi:ferrous iron transport protein B
MELPRYHRPRVKAVAQKTWFRLGEFVVIAWPILIAGGVVLEVFDYYQWSGPLNAVLATLAALARELGWRTAVAITVMTVGIVALTVGLRFAVGWVV